jgi:hypothetical protein
MTKSILFEIGAQIALLRQAKALLSSARTTAIKRKPGRPSKAAAVVVPVAQKAKKRKKMSAEGRERVRQAQIKRWAAVRQAAKTTAAPLSTSKKKSAKAAAGKAARVRSQDSTQQSRPWESLMSRIYA